MTRPYCEICEFPSRTCICDLVNSVPQMEYPGQIHVLQHPDEVNHPKNTLRLAKLILPTITIWPGECANDFIELSHRIASEPERWACIYPGSNSIRISTTAPNLPESHLLFIDATWRKARKIWHLNPWLHGLPLYHLPDNLTAQYAIRKNHASYQLSTLEAIAYTIIHSADISPLMELFVKFQYRTQRFIKTAKIKS